MRFCVPSFTENRRRRLAKKVDLDRLETRNTITEPISVTSLAVTALTGAAHLGFILPSQASNALSRLVLPADVAKQVGRTASNPIVFRGNLLKPSLGIDTEAGVGGAGGWSTAAP